MVWDLGGQGSQVDQDKLLSELGGLGEVGNFRQSRKGNIKGRQYNTAIKDGCLNNLALVLSVVVVNLEIVQIAVGLLSFYVSLKRQN